MIGYLNIYEFINKKSDLYNYINPFFNKNYLKSHNFFFLLMALNKYKSYFDNLYINVDHNIRLDTNQRIAILTNSKNELIIAGAGSGKTTTIAAKIKYMVDILKIDANDILLLSYTNEAVNEMKKIIIEKFQINVKILTFHKFAILLLNGRVNIEKSICYDDFFNKCNLIYKLILIIYIYIFYNVKIIDIKEKNSKISAAFTSLQNDISKYYFEHLELKKGIKSYIFKKIVNIYINSNDNLDTLDFIIYKASNLKKFDHHFKYLLIDEYQDISNLRFNFIKNYISIENSSLMCVGDDWQTIYSFASSNINNILNFAKNFFDYKIIKIVNTYRNSQELIDIAGQFIMKSDKQIKKKLKSKKRINEPIEIVNYKNKEEMIYKISSLIDQKKDYKIAILGRYRNDLMNIIDNKNFKWENDKIVYKNYKEIDYFTIHTSKGLGFDYVFLINNKDGYYGFPPTRKVKSLFIAENPIFEERRLFYVALTRTKNKIYLLSPIKKNSIFLKEIKKMLKKK